MNTVSLVYPDILSSKWRSASPAEFHISWRRAGSEMAAVTAWLESEDIEVAEEAIFAPPAMARTFDELSVKGKLVRIRGMSLTFSDTLDYLAFCLRFPILWAKA